MAQHPPAAGQVSDQAGTTTGNSARDVTGKATGKATGDVTGNTAGDATGNAAGDTVCDATGDTAGNAVRDATGNTAGDVTGDAASGAPARRHVHEFNVRFGDIDVLGHVNNCRYLGYLEDARVAMFRLDPQRDGRAPLRGLVVARHEIDYRRPLLFRPEPVRVETWVTETRAASFAVEYEIRDDRHVFATAKSVIVAYDLENSRARRLSDEETAFLAAYQQSH